MIVKYENDTRYDDDNNEKTIYTHDKYNNILRKLFILTERWIQFF